MRLNTLLLAVLFACHGIHAWSQSWCPPGAEWSFYYLLNDWNPGESEEGILHSRYIGDTLVNGQNCQRITHDFFYDILGGAQNQHRSGTPTITRFDDGVAYILSPFTGQFDTLLWFGAEPGDHWSVFSVGSNTHWFVTGVDSVEIGGVPLRKMAVSWMDMSTSGQIRTDTIYERIGPAWSFLFYPYNYYVNFQQFDLRCYHDQDLLWSRNTTTTCEFPAGIGDVDDGITVGAFPNPGSDQLNVEVLAKGPMEVWVSDATGRTMARITAHSGTTALNTGSWAPGLYQVRVVAGDGNHWLRWVKQ